MFNQEEFGKRIKSFRMKKTAPRRRLPFVSAFPNKQFQNGKTVIAYPTFTT